MSGRSQWVRRNGIRAARCRVLMGATGPRPRSYVLWHGYTTPESAHRPDPLRVRRSSHRELISSPAKASRRYPRRPGSCPTEPPQQEYALVSRVSRAAQLFPVRTRAAAPGDRPAGTAAASAEGPQFFGPNRNHTFVFRSARTPAAQSPGTPKTTSADTRRVATVKQRSGRLGNSNRQATGDRGRPPAYSAGAAEEQRRPRPGRRRRPRSLRSRRIHAQPHHAESG